MSREHSKDDENCWCNPIVEQACPESLGKKVCDPNCWRCGGKTWIKPWSREHPILIIHNEEDEEE